MRYPAMMAVICVLAGSYAVGIHGDWGAAIFLGLAALLCFEEAVRGPKQPKP